MEKARRPGLVRATFFGASATLLSRILGLLREQVFAYYFGASAITDAFQIAFRIPNLLRDLFAEGALSSSLVPSYVEVREEYGERRGWRFFGIVHRFLFLFVSLISLLGACFSEPLVGFYAAKFRADPAIFLLTVTLTQILFAFFPFVALAACFMGVLNARGRFFIPAFASAVFNFISIIFGVLLGMWLVHLGYERIYGMALAFVLGGIAQALIQYPVLKNEGYAFSYDPARDRPWYKEVGLDALLRRFFPSLISLTSTQVSVLVNSVLATAQGFGAVSWLAYAFRLIQLPIGIFGVSVANANLAQFSSHIKRQENLPAQNALTQALNLIGLTNWIFGALLLALAPRIVSLLFEYGRFTNEDTRQVALAIRAYTVGIVAFSGIKVLGPATFALKKNRIAALSSLGALGVSTVISLTLVGRFGFWVLALSAALGAWFNFGVLLAAVRPWIVWTRIRRALIFHVGSAVGIGAILFFMDQRVTYFSLIQAGLVKAPFFFRSIILGGEGVIFILWGILMGVIFPRSEFSEMNRLFRRRLSKP